MRGSMEPMAPPLDLLLIIILPTHILPLLSSSMNLDKLLLSHSIQTAHNVISPLLFAQSGIPVMVLLLGDTLK